FTLYTPEKLHCSGWFKIQLRLVSKITYGTAKIYIDYGFGYFEENSISIPFITGNLHTKVFYLKSKAYRLRFDPIECATSFSIQHLSINKISSRQAKILMLNYLKSKI